MEMKVKIVNKGCDVINGSRELILRIMNELGPFSENGIVIDECELNLKFHKPDDDQESSISVDVTKTSLERLLGFDNIKDRNRKDLIMILEEYSDDKYGWMSEDEFNMFANRFYMAYEKMIGVIKTEHYYDHISINDILKEEKLGYRIRHLITGKKPYIIDRL